MSRRGGSGAQDGTRKKVRAGGLPARCTCMAPIASGSGALMI